MDIGSFLVSVAALATSVMAYYFAIKSWRESNRPIVTAHVVTHTAGNLVTALNIVVRNSGNRPAKNVRLSIESETLKRILKAVPRDPVRISIERCFSDQTRIPILINGEEISNDFGTIGAADGTGTWTDKTAFEIRVSYEDIDGRQYAHRNPLLIVETSGFAQSSWERR